MAKALFKGKAVADGKGGYVFPDDLITVLKNKLTIDGIEYPAINYEGKLYPLIKTAQGWTCGGEVANAQHAKNVANGQRTPRFEKFKAKHAKSNL
jgi:hypothetical protein